MQNLVKIVAISDVRTDKNGREFKLITVSSANRREFTDPVTNESLLVVGRPKRTNIVSYAKTYLDDAPHYLYDLPVGTAVSGNIVTKTVEPYTIETTNGPKEITRYTTFVEADQEDADYNQIVQRAFENSGHTIVEKSAITVEDTTEEKKELPQVDPADAFDSSQEETSEEEQKVPVVAEGDDFEDDF